MSNGAQPALQPAEILVIPASDQSDDRSRGKWPNGAVYVLTGFVGQKREDRTESGRTNSQQDGIKTQHQHYINGQALRIPRVRRQGFGSELDKLPDRRLGVGRNPVVVD